ncbi:hypothetical protein J2790_001704 [Paenarthrobacter nicotinovorans]|uniref:glycosyl hydrolase 2 galactose-binding domain-containing protein n=1 Tax=Micrococcaceae TaxID=1268 RepID=UPI000875FA05|nr:MULTISPECIES: hypothetical protein [Micrococcaceae]MDR6436583.1 hypothetical protein [Paenarthrobacter nicotinovorans]SCZ57242.1 hypothetical protein SAMN02799638_02108 [Arthrobacter sp. UNCCL28]
MTHQFRAELEMGARNRALSSGWYMRLVEGPAPRRVSGQLIPASRPGAISHDLTSVGLLSAASASMTAQSVDWVARCGWEYSVDFPWRSSGEGRAKLIFHGLSPTASASINGHALQPDPGQGPAFHDVDALLLNGINTLKITLIPEAAPAPAGVDAPTS